VLPTLGNFVQKHAEAVALKANVTALNICADPSSKETIEITEELIRNVHTINVYYKKVTHGTPGLSQFQKLSRIIRAYSKGIKLARKKLGTIDLVHHNIIYPSGLAALYLKRSENIPYIISEHSTSYLSSKNSSIGKREKTISRMIVRNASAVVPVSLDLKAAMLSHGLNGDYRIIFNVVDTSLFHPGIKEEHKKIKFLHVSTLDDPHKNISGMLHAVKKLISIRTDFECWFVGDGDIAPHDKTAEQLGIYNTFAFFDGTKSTAEIASLMQGADCFMMFSNYENLPVVIIEAFASGLPVISSFVGGIPEHVNQARGILVAPKDENAFTNAMNEMINGLQKKIYNADELAAYAGKNFSYESVCNEFHDLYLEILNRNV
jgi:glycosyltransferase involved in cell wall biosynthesis